MDRYIVAPCKMSAFIRDEEEQTFRRLCAAVMVGRGEEFLLSSLKIGRLVSMPHVIDRTDIEIFLASLGPWHTMCGGVKRVSLYWNLA